MYEVALALSTHRCMHDTTAAVVPDYNSYKYPFENRSDINLLDTFRDKCVPVGTEC